MAKKRAPKALPTNWNLEQLDEELRVALGLTKRPGVGRFGDGMPFVYPQLRERALRARKGAPKHTVTEPVPWTQAQQDKIDATFAAHVADPDFAVPPDRIRLRELRAKGWANLTAVERLEAQKILFESR